MSPLHTADAVVDRLVEQRADVEVAKLRKRVPVGDDVIGVRMGDLFEIARSAQDLTMDEIGKLLDNPAYEPRMAAFCVLDYQARRPLDDDARAERYDLYLRRHDRITTWDMVDRAAPRVVGGYLAGRPPQPLLDLARSDHPLERRTAITAPLYFVKRGSADDVGNGFSVAAVLAADREPVVHHAVGIFLKHAGRREPALLHAFLDVHAGSMAPAARRLATEQLDPAERARYRA